jgi:hypothetical protein
MFNLFVSLYSNWISCSWQINGSCFFILFIYLFIGTGCPYVAQAEFKLVISLPDLPSAGTMGLHHHTSEDAGFLIQPAISDFQQKSYFNPLKFYSIKI